MLNPMDMNHNKFIKLYNADLCANEYCNVVVATAVNKVDTVRKPLAVSFSDAMIFGISRRLFDMLY